MTDLEYVPWRETHYCQPPPLHDVAREAGLRLGTRWTCPECGAVSTVVKIDGSSLNWLSYGPHDAKAKFAEDMERLRKSDPGGAQWVERILDERAERQRVDP